MKKSLSALIVLSLVLVACQSSKKVSETSTTTHTEEIVKTKQKVNIAIPEKTVEFSTEIPVFQPIRFVKNGKVVHEHHFSKFNNDSTSILNGKIDSLGNLFISERQLAHNYSTEIEVQNKIIKELTEKTTVFEKQQTWFGKQLEKLIWIIICLFVLFVILLFTFEKIKKIFLSWL